MRAAQRTDSDLRRHYLKVSVAESLVLLDAWVLGAALAYWGTFWLDPLPTPVVGAVSRVRAEPASSLAGLPKESAADRERRLKAEMEADERRSTRATYGETCRVGGNGAYLCGRGTAP